MRIIRTAASSGRISHDRQTWASPKAVTVEGRAEGKDKGKGKASEAARRAEALEEGDCVGSGSEEDFATKLTDKALEEASTGDYD